MSKSPRCPPVIELVPHEPPMLLIDELIEWSPAQALIHATIRPGNPFVSDGQMPATVLLEYMAQAIAAADGMAIRQGSGQGSGQGDGDVGLLLGTRELELRVDALALGDRLALRVVREYSDGKLARYACTAQRIGDPEDELLAIATINVMMTSAEEVRS